MRPSPKTESPTTRLPDRKVRRRILLAVLAGGLLLGGATASVLGDMMAQGTLDPAVIDALKTASGGKEMLLIITVNEDGEVAPFCGLYHGKPCQIIAYEHIPNPKKEIFGFITVGNPKVCWKTSGGGQECMTY